MTKPTVAEHRTAVRNYHDDTTTGSWSDATVDTEIKNALAILSTYQPYLTYVRRIDLTAEDTEIDLVNACPADAVVEVIPLGLDPITEFRARGTVLILKSPIGSTTADFYYRGKYSHDGTYTDWYPPQFFGPVCMMATALCLFGIARVSIEGNTANAAIYQQIAARYFDTASAIFAGVTAPSPVSTFTKYS